MSGTLKITDLPATSSLSGTEVFAVVQGGQTVQVTTLVLANYAAGQSSAVNLVVGSSNVTSGTTTRVLYDNGGKLGEYTISGSGSVAMTTSPTFTTPVLGAATATSLNKVTLTTPATGSTLTISDGKTLTANNTVTLSGTDGSTISFGAGGTVVYNTTNSLPSLATVGTISSGTWQATPVALAYGGTNANLTASNGGIFYSTASAAAILSGTATGSQILMSGPSSAPSWSTATYPATAAAGTFLAAGSTNVVSASASPTLGVQQTTRGQLILANTAAGAFPTTLQSSNSSTAALTVTLPPNSGSSGYVLGTDGAGTTNWIQQSSLYLSGVVTALATLQTLSFQ